MNEFARFRRLNSAAIAALLAFGLTAHAVAQNVVVAPSEAIVEGEAPGIATTAPVLPSEIQVVRFQAPVGTKIEILGPEPTPILTPEAPGGVTVGLRVGVGYRLKVSNFPTRPGAVLYPVVEIVGHLHRPVGIDPATFPIRVIFHEDDIEDIVYGGRLVTQVVYLEDPEQALPIHLPKDEIPSVTVSPAEEPLKVASALGRVMAIVRLGGRTPTAEEISGSPIFDIPAVPCPFSGPNGTRCEMACGPATGTPPESGKVWLPKDEFLCDGGDRAMPTHFGGDGTLRGIDPRDAVIQFRDDKRPRILPTNVVCIYAPRFGVVRASIGAFENKTVDVLRGIDILQRESISEAEQGPIKMVQNQAAELNRNRLRASAMKGREVVGGHVEVRILIGIDNITHIKGHKIIQGVELANNRQKAAGNVESIFPQAIKTGEGPVVTGIYQGAGEKVMAWKPQEVAGVEVPPNKPGMAVIKRVSTGQAEPGDVVTYSIQFRNMGNIPITQVRIVDSLLPRLEYVPRSARGPAGSIFTAAENTAGGMQLRWDVGTIAPGAEGYVSFDARVR